MRLAAVAELDLPGHAGDRDLDAVVETLGAALAVPVAVVDVLTPGLQTYPAETGVGAAYTRLPDRLSFCAEVVDTGRPLLVPDARTHPVYRDNPLVQQGLVTSFAGHPLVHHGAVVGAVAVLDRAPRAFGQRELAVLEAQARLASTVLRLRWTASHDPLTGLANRRRVAERVTAVEQGAAGLLFVDVDDFKQVNDTFGHAQGDALLCELGVLLRQAVAGSGGLAARWGGDEFLVLLPGAGTARAQRTAQELARAVRERASLPASVTVGVAAAQEGWRWDDLLSAAAGAAAGAKAGGKDRVALADRGRAGAVVDLPV